MKVANLGVEKAEAINCSRHSAPRSSSEKKQAGSQVKAKKEKKFCRST